MNNIFGALQSLLNGGESGNGSAGGTEALINNGINQLIQVFMKK